MFYDKGVEIPYAPLSYTFGSYTLNVRAVGGPVTSPLRAASNSGPAFSRYAAKASLDSHKLKDPNSSQRPILLRFR